ncbi:MAG TPA: IS21 family transposase [Actinocrinis sp.]|jgi:transposase
MANLLKMAISETIRTLHRRGWSQRRIADELGVNRETVARHLRLPEPGPKPANAPAGSQPADGAAKPAIAPTGSGEADGAPDRAVAPVGPGAVPPPRGSGRLSGCEPWREPITAKAGQRLSAQRIYQDLVADHGFAGSYYCVRRFVRRLEGAHDLPFRRIESDPGDEAQVDFGAGAPVVGPDGKRQRTHVLRVVLSHSRKGYSEAVYRQTTDDFLRCLEGAFRHFGGVPRRLVLDNLKAAVTKADWFDPEINPKVRSFGEHYATVFLPTRPYTPRHKGKVERGVDYVQENALRGRSFAGLDEQNRFLRDWELNVADTRVHGTTRRQVGKHFDEAERAALLPLPPDPFPSFREARRTVHRDGHVEVDHAYYSVPPEYLARKVWVRWDARMVRVFNDRMEQVAVHVRHEPGRFSTQSVHIASEKVSGVERGAAWHLARARRLGPESARWAEATVEARGVEAVRVLIGLLGLADRHPVAAIERACAIAASYGSHHLRTVRALIERDAPRQETMPFMSEHPMIRPLSDYGRLVHDAFQKEEVLP